MHPTSLEKRFKMRPTGLVSKNRTGAFITALVIWSWRFSEAFRAARQKQKEDISVRNKEPVTMDPNTKSVVQLFCCSNGISVIRESHQKGAIKNTEIKRTVCVLSSFDFEDKSSMALSQVVPKNAINRKEKITKGRKYFWHFSRMGEGQVFPRLNFNLKLCLNKRLIIYRITENALFLFLQQKESFLV